MLINSGSERVKGGRDRFYALNWSPDQSTSYKISCDCN